MARLHQPLTWLSVALSALGLALLFGPFKDLPSAVVILLLAHGCALAEFKKYTGRFQFIMILVGASLTGIAIDQTTGATGSASLSMLLSALAIVLRQAYMPVFTYVGRLWVEPLLLTAAAIPMAYTWSVAPFSWITHAFPLFTFSAAAFLSLSYLQDAAMMKRRTRNGYRVHPGMEAPDFVLSDQDGGSVRLSSYRGAHPVLLIFVRGDWCPGCHMMLRTYERHHERFRSRGIHVLAIGPDDVAVNRDMVQRIGVGYRLLSDPAQDVSQRYGVVYDNPAIEAVVDYAEGIPLPASFLVDIHGVVRYVSRPDRVGEFLDPTLIFGVLDRLPEAGPDKARAA